MNDRSEVGVQQRKIEGRGNIGAKEQREILQLLECIQRGEQRMHLLHTGIRGQSECGPSELGWQWQGDEWRRQVHHAKQFAQFGRALGQNRHGLNINQCRSQKV